MPSSISRSHVNWTFSATAVQAAEKTDLPKLGEGQDQTVQVEARTPVSNMNDKEVLCFHSKFLFATPRGQSPPFLTRNLIGAGRELVMIIDRAATIKLNEDMGPERLYDLHAIRQMWKVKRRPYIAEGVQEALSILRDFSNLATKPFHNTILTQTWRASHGAPTRTLPDNTVHISLEPEVQRSARQATFLGLLKDQTRSSVIPSAPINIDSL